MKNLLYIALLVLAYSIQAQTKSASAINDIQTANKNLAGGLWISNNSNEDVVGTPYLFNSWNNFSKLYTDDAVYSLNSFNYNIELERFEAKFSEDSVLVMNTGNLNKIVINTIELTPYYDDEFQKITFFEEVTKLKNVVLLKKFLVRIQEGSFNPMTQVKIKPDSYVKEEQYYIKNNDEVNLKPIKLKKSTILKLIDSDHQSEIKTYAKAHKLKYNKVSDVHKMLQYYNSLTI